MSRKQGLAVIVASGGLDSTVLAYRIAADYDLLLVGFDYGQKHVKELQSLMTTAEKLGSRYAVVDLSGLSAILAGSQSSLITHGVDVPEGHYAEETMKSTVVPNRNSIMGSIAYGIAVAQGAKIVAMGVHAGDHAVYPDCRPEWSEDFGHAMRLANEGFGDPELRFITPFVHFSKAQIVTLGRHLQVPFEDTWSCYKGGRYHCRRCGTCVERVEAFELAGVEDPTEYDPEG